MCYTVPMEINQEQYDRIKHILPVQRGNVAVDNMTFINALLYICENGCPGGFGLWPKLPALSRGSGGGGFQKYTATGM